MKRMLKNQQMVEMIGQLQPLLSQRNKIGYVAARNTRMLSDQLVEFEQVRRDLIEQYGTDTEDENGATIKMIKFGTPEFRSFCDAIEPFAAIEHEVELMTAKYDDVIGCLSGEEILAIDWMLED
jgi:phage-related minor tail protein